MILLVLLIFMASFFSFPILTTPFLLIPITYRTRFSKYFLFLFILGISLISLRYIPYFTDDAAYHYKAAYIFQNYDNIFDWFFNLMSRTIPTEYGYYNYPLFGVLLYIFSFTGTYSLVSFVVSFIVYYSYIGILYDIYKKYKFSKLLFICSLITLIVMVNVRYTTSGMRYSLAVALTILIFYKEIKNQFKIRRSILLYAIPLLIHASVIIPVLIRILLPWLRRKSFLKKSLVLFSLPLLTLLSDFMQDLGIDYISFLFEKFDTYQDTSTFIELFKLSDLFNVYIGVLICVLFIIFYSKYLKSYTDIYVKNFFTLTSYICLLTLSSLLFLTILDRFVWYVYPTVIISLILYISGNEKSKIKSKNRILYVYFILILCFVGGLIGNKKFLDFLRLIDFNTVEIFTKNIFEYFRDLHHFSLGDVWVR